MDITCNSCKNKLSISEEDLPKDVNSISGECPHCQQTIEIKLRDPASAECVPAAPPAPVPPVPAPPIAKEPPAPKVTTSVAPEPVKPSNPPVSAPPPPSLVEVPTASIMGQKFDEDNKLAMVCFDDPAAQAHVKTELESMGYNVHIPATVSDSVMAVKKNRYDVLLLHLTYGGSQENNVLFKALQPMAMNLRRQMCVGLVAATFRTLDNMEAFAKSVNFVVNDSDVPKIKSIVHHAVTENDQFYLVFREAIRNAGKI